MSAPEIIAAAGRAFGLTYSQTISQDRRAKFVKARTAATFALRARGMSYPQIGKRLGGRDHSTIVNYVRTYARLLDDPAFAEIVEQLKAMTFATIHEPIVARLVLPFAQPTPQQLLKARKTPRKQLRDGEIDGDELNEAEFNAMLVRGSRALNAAIASQFCYGGIAA